MFVKTENHGIINLNCFPQVDVVEHRGVWLLQAFYQKPPNAPTFFLSGFSLAEFKEEVQAQYSFCHLYSALEAGLSVWDPRAVESFFSLWNKARRELSSNNPRNKTFVRLDELEELTLEITGLREITISDLNAVASEKEKGYIENKIKTTLKTVDPMREKVVWKIDWKDIHTSS